MFVITVDESETWVECKKTFPSFNLFFFQLRGNLMRWNRREVKPVCRAEPVKNRTINETLSDFSLLGLQLLDRVSPAHLVRQMAQLTRERGEWERRWLKKKREGGGEGETGEEEGRGGGGRSDWKQISSLKGSTPPHVSAPTVDWSHFHSNFYAQSKRTTTRFHASLLVCSTRARALARTRVRTSRRRWILRKSWSRVALRAESGTDGRAVRRLCRKLWASSKLCSVDGTFRLFSHIKRWFSPCLRELDNPRPGFTALFDLPWTRKVWKWRGGGGEGKKSLLWCWQLRLAEICALCALKPFIYTLEALLKWVLPPRRSPCGWSSAQLHISFALWT